MDGPLPLPDSAFRPADDLGFPGRFAVPAFVNAHTHLELTFQEGRATPRPAHFPAWVAELVGGARAASEETFKASFRDGLERSLRHGSTAILDHCRRAAFLVPEAAAFPGRLVTAYEYSGFEPDRAAAFFEPVLEVRGRFPDAVRAISPVAPHSVSADLYALSIRYAREEGLLLCGHLAETAEEVEFLRSGTGPFRDHASVWGARDLSGFTPPGCTPVEFLRRLGGLGPRTVVAHANHLTDADVASLAAAGAHVVHCPGSYRFFGHSTFRLADLLEAGVNVCLGTDSLASTDTLSVLSEMRRLRVWHPDLADETIFRMGTVNGLRALAGGEAPADPGGDAGVFAWRGRPPKKVTKERVLRELLTGDAGPLAVIVAGRVVAAS